MVSAHAFGQCSIHRNNCDENCVAYTEKQDISCLKCLQNAPLKDSIIATQTAIIDVKDSIIVVQQNFIDTTDTRIHMINDELTAAMARVAKEQKKGKFKMRLGLGIGATGGGILGFLIGRATK